MRKIRTIFGLENWLWKTNFCSFWHLPIDPILKIQPYLFCMLIFRQKTFQFCIPFENLITHPAIFCMLLATICSPRIIPELLTSLSRDLSSLKFLPQIWNRPFFNGWTKSWILKLFLQLFGPPQIYGGNFKLINHVTAPFL